MISYIRCEMQCFHTFVFEWYVTNFAIKFTVKLVTHCSVIVVIFDKEELQKIHKINSKIKNVINVAPFRIAIFSTSHVESKWYMDEILLMVESTSIIIRVFYGAIHVYHYHYSSVLQCEACKYLVESCGWQERSVCWSPEHTQRRKNI